MYCKITSLAQLLTIKRKRGRMAGYKKKGQRTFGEVLFVGKDENDGVSHFSIVDDPMEFLPGFVDPVPIRAVHHKDEPLRPCVVMPPKGADLILPANILQGPQKRIMIHNAQLTRSFRLSPVSTG